MIAGVKRIRPRSCQRGKQYYNKFVVITSREEQLVAEFRKLPAGAAEEVSALIHRLAALPAGAEIDWSDEWSDEDLRDITVASLKEFEAREQH
jgi:hypothetical protein